MAFRCYIVFLSLFEYHVRVNSNQNNVFVSVFYLTGVLKIKQEINIFDKIYGETFKQG